MKFTRFLLPLCVYMCVSQCVLSNDVSSAPPNFVFIVADDLGWNDIGFHNPEIISPNLDKLAITGVILEQYYVQFLCTPSRNAFMTGCYPFRTGLQHSILETLTPAGIPLEFPLLPEKLRELDYATHMVGKWHLGYCNLSYTPTYRGFDSFLGYYNGAETYFSHEGSEGYLDFRNNTAPERNYNGTYSTLLFREEAVNIISSHNSSQPLFMYLPFQAVHSPLQVPEAYVEMYSHIKDENRRNYSAMVTALDDAIGNITAALKSADLYNNTIIIFTTDNGGQTLYGGNNYPLRGNKNTLWEGGTRGVAFVHSPLLKKTRYINTNLIHAVDWFSTILSLADPRNQSDSSQLTVDGIDQWSTISEDAPTNRKEFVYNIDNYKNLFNAAIRIGDYKLIVGDPGVPDGWIPPKNLSSLSDEEKTTSTPPPKFDIYLFNLKDDPTEHFNIAMQLPSKVKEMWRVLMKYKQKAVEPFWPPSDPAGFPTHWGGVYSPGWCSAK